MYELIWKGEVIDTCETLAEAMYLKIEYEMAYGGNVNIKEEQDYV
jgi:hypothetical protein